MITTKLSHFGKREIILASKLLDSYAHAKETVYFKDILRLEFNQETGLVYLVDTEGNKAVYHDFRYCLEDWIECVECGNGNFYRNFGASMLECCRQNFLALAKANNIFDGGSNETD